MTRGKKLLMLHAGVVCGVILYALVTEWTGIGCPIRRLTGIPCPSCGMTRATLAIMRFRLREAADLNPMVFLFYPYLFLLFHCRTRIFLRWKRGILYGILIGGAGVFFAVYLFRLLNGEISC